MTAIRKYFTYIPNIIKNSDYPGGMYENPSDFISVHYNPSVILEDFKLEHYEGNDSRILVCAISDDTKLVNEGGSTVIDFMLNNGLKNFNCTPLSDNEALNLAKIFSPVRTIEGIDSEGNPTTLTVSEFAWDGSTPPKLIQTIS